MANAMFLKSLGGLGPPALDGAQRQQVALTMTAQLGPIDSGKSSRVTG